MQQFYNINLLCYLLYFSAHVCSLLVASADLPAGRERSQVSGGDTVRNNSTPVELPEDTAGVSTHRRSSTLS